MIENVTVGQAVEDYLIFLRAIGRAASTAATYAASLRLLTGSLPENFPLASLSEDALTKLVSTLAGAETPGGSRRMQSTLNRHRSTYRGFLRWAFETGRITANPALRLRLARVDSAPTPPMTLAEARQFLGAIRQSGDPLRLRDEALFTCYAMAGLRRNEALGLEVSDFDAAGGFLRVKQGKWGQARLVPVAATLGGVLERYRRECIGWSGRQAGLLFPGRTEGGCLHPRQAQSRFEHWSKLAGLRKELTIHSFRAGFATGLHDGTSDVLLVSRALGHRDLRSTLRYVDPDAKKVRDAIERRFGACG